MNRAEELAAELERSIGDLHAELDAIPDEQWYGAITGPEGWRVGHTAHHIGEGYEQSRTWIERSIAEGMPVVLDAAIDLPKVNEANARCLVEHGQEERPTTMAFVRDRGEQLVKQVAQLTDQQLDQPMMVVMGEARVGSLVALPMALRHATNHLQSIRQATLPQAAPAS